MKKILVFLTILLLTASANAAMTFSDAYSDTKPMAVLIYADWADDYATALTGFRGMQQELGDIYNYVELNIASEDTKEYNKQNVILPNVPYVMLYRSNCKISRLIDKNCALSPACALPKMKSFIRQ